MVELASDNPLQMMMSPARTLNDTVCRLLASLPADELVYVATLVGAKIPPGWRISVTVSTAEIVPESLAVIAIGGGFSRIRTR
jgi:hypothetical protein